MSDRFIESSFIAQDPVYEQSLRPKKLDEFLGQKQVKEQLEVLIGAAKQRKEPLGHSLFCGPPGLGKTTLSHILAASMEANIIVVSGPIIERPGDVAGVLTKLKAGDVLFIDEIHRLPRAVEEYLYSAMEDFVLDIVIDSGINSRSVKVQLNRFTLIGATTRAGLISAPLRSRFGITCRLDYYDPEILGKVVERSSVLLGITADVESICEIANRSRGTPRIANNLLRWVRDYAQMKAGGVFTKETTRQALQMIAIDEKGLDDIDVRILRTLIEYYAGGPVGLTTLAVAIGEEPHTLEEVHEPYLIIQGFLKRTLRGREATPLAYQHLGYENTNKQR